MLGVIVLGVLISMIHSINFQLNGDEPFCLKINGGGNFFMSFISSGVNENSLEFTLVHGQQQIKKITQKNQAEFNVQLPPESSLACFKTFDPQSLIISFDFFKQADPLRQVIDKKDMQIVEQTLRQSAKQLGQIGRNQQFHIERDQIHKRILQESQKRIKWAGVIKIVFLMSSALIQLWIMKGFFKQAQPYQPVSNM